MSIDYLLVFAFLELHLLELFVEELCMGQVLLLLSDELCLLKIQRVGLPFIHLNFLFHLLFPLTFLFALLLEVEHLLVCFFELCSLFSLPFLFGVIKSLLESHLFFVLRLDLDCQVVDLLLLYLLHSNGLASRLFNLFNELLLFLLEVLDAGNHFLLILLSLNILLFGDPDRAFGSFSESRLV